MHIRGYWVIAFWACAGLLVAFGIWRGAEHYAQQGLQLRQVAAKAALQAQADLLAGYLDQELGKLRGTVEALALDVNMVPLLAHALVLAPVAVDSGEAHDRALWQSDPRSTDMAQRFSAISQSLGLANLLLLDRFGRAVASGGTHGPHVATGMRFYDRDYFYQALTDQNYAGWQFVVARSTGVRSLVYARAIRSERNVVGVLIGTLDTDSIALPMAPQAWQWIIRDSHQIVIRASNPAWVLHGIGDGRWACEPASALLDCYQQPITPLPDGLFSALEEAPHEPSSVRLLGWQSPQSLVIHAHSQTTRGGLTVQLRHETALAQELRMRMMPVLGLALLCGALLLAFLASLSVGIARLRHRDQKLQELNQQLEQQATTDALTGCANRRQFLEVLEREALRLGRVQLPLSVLSLDLDHFKRVNDLYGHATGDAVLVAVVRAIESQLRRTDLLGRLGGEEFSVVLPGTPEPAARLVAEKIRTTIEALTIPLAGKNVRQATVQITVSLGGVTAQPGLGHESTAARLLALCDEALYSAKRSGRNQIVWAQNNSSTAPPSMANAARSDQHEPTQQQKPQSE